MAFSEAAAAKTLYGAIAALVGTLPIQRLAFFNGVFALSLALFFALSGPMTTSDIKRSRAILLDLAVLKISIVNLVLRPDTAASYAVFWAWYCGILCLVQVAESARRKLEDRARSVAQERRAIALLVGGMVVCVLIMMGLTDGIVSPLFRSATLKGFAASASGGKKGSSQPIGGPMRDIDIALVLAVDPLIVAFVIGRTLMRWSLSRGVHREAANEGSRTSTGRHLLLIDFLLDAPVYLFRIGHHLHLWMLAGGLKVGLFDGVQAFSIYSAVMQLLSRFKAYFAGSHHLSTVPGGRVVMTVTGPQRLGADGRPVDGQASPLGPNNFGSGTTGGGASPAVSLASAAGSLTTAAATTTTASSGAGSAGSGASQISSEARAALAAAEADIDIDSEEIEREVTAIKRKAKDKGEKPDPFALADARKRAMIRRGRRDYLQKRRAEEREKAEVMAAVAAADKAEAEAAAAAQAAAAAKARSPPAAFAAAPVAAATAATVAAAPSATPTAVTAPVPETEEEARARRLEAARRRLNAAANRGAASPSSSLPAAAAGSPSVAGEENQLKQE